jgi:hypothetical protein
MTVHILLRAVARCCAPWKVIVQIRIQGCVKLLSIPKIGGKLESEKTAGGNAGQHRPLKVEWRMLSSSLPSRWRGECWTAPPHDAGEGNAVQHCPLTLEGGMLECTPP